MIKDSITPVSNGHCGGRCTKGPWRGGYELDTEATQLSTCRAENTTAVSGAEVCSADPLAPWISPSPILSPAHPGTSHQLDLVETSHQQGLVAHTYNPSVQKAGRGGLSSRSAWATLQDPVKERKI